MDRASSFPNPDFEGLAYEILARVERLPLSRSVRKNLCQYDCDALSWKQVLRNS
jgi:hypothetical protein